MRYPIILHTDDEKQFGVTVPDLPGCFSQGETVESAIENAREAILFHADGLLSENQAIPLPSEIVDLAGFHGDSGTALIAYADVDLEGMTGACEQAHAAHLRLDQRDWSRTRNPSPMGMGFRKRTLSTP